MTDHERDARDLRILALRDAGWTVKDIARDAGLSVSFVNKLFRECAA